MAAYAALVSLEHIIHNLLNHSRPPISLHKEQAYVLTEKVSFLQEFLQVYNPNLPWSKEADPLETRIACAAYAAEDSIESHIADQYTEDGEKMSSDGFYEALEKVIEDMALIEKEAMEIKETVGFQNQLQAKSTTPADSSGSTSLSSIAQKQSSMVGADNLLLELKDKLTADARHLQTIPIVGMGGSGKTTLASNIYQDGLIKEYFDIRAWVTISQEYNFGEILKQLLTQLIGEPKKELSEGELGEMLHKHLYGRRYMIVLDDMWSVGAWDGVKRSLPNNNKGSRIVITTRLTTLASVLPNSDSLGMKLLDENDSWGLLSKTVFGEKGFCPLEFEAIGKKIVKNCKGLPLSIVVLGGLLARSERLIGYWENMEENLNAIVNLEDDKRCLKTLYMSYKQLPVHLKPCFLYMGIYHEDHEISVSKLIKLWVAEGFLKPVSGKRPEDVAVEYLKDLIGRNLIMIHKLGSIGSIKECKIHDLLRDLCLREAQKEGFYIVNPGHEIGNWVSRIVMNGTNPGIEEIGAFSSAPLTRSLILDLYGEDHTPHISRKQLRIVSCAGSRYAFTENVHQLVNCRVFTSDYIHTKFPSSTWLFWNLQTLIVTYSDYVSYTAPSDIWYMSHIKHLYFNDLYLPDPPPSVQDGTVLANLQTLATITNFKCSEEVVKRIPNIRKLTLIYTKRVRDRFCLTNLDRLHKLESLKCELNGLQCQINYPQSLRKLTLQGRSTQQWQAILDKIGDLPLLQKLTLYKGTFTNRGNWETTDGQFCSLKFLSIKWCEGFYVWTTEASHFPRLEQLHLYDVPDLKEIPWDFAESSTLALIDMECCTDSAIRSAKRVSEEQEALYGEEDTTLQVEVKLWGKNDRALASLRSPNFHVA